MLQIHASFRDADDAEARRYAAMSPQARLALTLDLQLAYRSRSVKLQTDLREFLRLLSSHGAKDHLIANKLASGRSKDRADVEALRAIDSEPTG